MPIAKVQMPDGRIGRFEVPEGTTPHEVVKFAQNMSAPKEPTWRNKLSQASHDYLPMIGGTAGSIVGGGGALIAGQLGPQIATPEEVVTVPAGVVTGGAIGTAGGEQLADIIDQWLGVAPKQTISEAITQAGENIWEGAKAESAGLLLGHGAGKTLDYLTDVVQRTGAGRYAKKKVGETLSALRQGEDTANLAGAQRTAGEVPGTRYTPGMGSGNRDLIALERGAIDSGQEGFGPIQQRTSDMLQGNVDAVKNKINTLPGKTVDFTSELTRQKNAMDAQRSALRGAEAPGQGARDALTEAQRPVKAAMEELEQRIPNYPMSTTNAQRVAAEILQDPRIPPKARQAVANALEMMKAETKRNGETTFSMMGVRRGLNEEIDQAFAGGKDQTGALLTRLKEGIDADFAELGARARTGQIKVRDGKVYRPDDLARELEENVVKTAELQAKQIPDMDAMQRELGPSAMRVPGEAEDSFLRRLTRDYKNKIGKDIPMMNDSGRQIADLQGRNRQLQETLAELEPGQDVGALLNAYNEYASTRFFDRFKTRSLNQATSNATPLEGVTKKFTTPTGSKDLIKAVGPEKAQDLMRAHYQADFSKILERNPTDAQLSRWFSDNRNILKRFGLDKEMFDVVKSQRGYREVEKLLGTDPNRIFEQIISGNQKQQIQTLNTTLSRLRGKPEAINGLKKAFAEYMDGKIIKPLSAGELQFGQVEKFMEEMAPTIKRLYSPQEQKALKSIRDAVALTQRLTKGSQLGGPKTAEIINQNAKEIIAGRKANPITSVLLSAGIVGPASVTGGWTGAMAGGMAATALETIRTAVRKYGDDAVRRTLARAMFDPDYAESLIKLTQARNAKGAAARDFSSKVGYMAGKGAASLSASTPPPSPTGN